MACERSQAALWEQGVWAETRTLERPRPAESSGNSRCQGPAAAARWAPERQARRSRGVRGVRAAGHGQDQGFNSGQDGGPWRMELRGGSRS